MGGSCSAYGEEERVYRVLVGNPEGKRPRHRWDDDDDDDNNNNNNNVLRWIFSKWDVEVWNGSSWLRIRTGGGHL
jgi:hypothetical protein